MSDLLDIIYSGGLLVFPLIFCAFVGSVLSFERMVFWLKTTATYSTKDVEHIYTLLTHKQFDDVKELLEKSKDPSLFCLKHCLASKGRIHPQILQSLAQQRLDQARKSMGALETIITVSPLLGILGTVVGIITSVTSLDLNQTQAFDSQVMIAGLSQALVTTALGLIISIVGLVIYGQFQTRLENLKSKFERDLSAFESLVSSK